MSCHCLPFVAHGVASASALPSVASTTPISDWTNCASNALRSRAARALRSVTENRQMKRNASGIENSAGFSYGKSADLQLKTATHTVLLNTTRTTELMSPARAPVTAPRVVVPRQKIAIASTGKLQLAATESARPAMDATFWFSKG